MTPSRRPPSNLGCAFVVLLASVTLLSSPGDAQVTAPAYAARRAETARRLGTDMLLVPARGAFSTDDALGFTQTPDFQYLTGLSDQVGAVFVIDGKEATSILFVAKPSRLVTRGIIAPTRASAEQLGLKDVQPIDSLESWLTRRIKRTPGAVYVSTTDARGAVTTPLPMAASGFRWRSYLTTLGATDVRPGRSILGPMREIKEEGELGIVRRVGQTSARALLAGITSLRPDRAERESELAVLNACVAAGARSQSFWPWTKSGATGVYTDLFVSFQSYEEPSRVMRAGELVRVDVGCQTDHYMGDVGRTAPVSGRFTAGQAEAWDLFIDGYKAGLRTLRNGVAVRTVYDAALAAMRRREPSLRTEEGRKAAAFLLGPDGTSPWEIHGVGLDDAEGQPDTLRTGMVVAYEPMFAVGNNSYYLEDMLAITATGYEQLTPGLPYTSREIEAVMARRSRHLGH